MLRHSQLLWLRSTMGDSIRYLGVHFVRGRYFKCNLDNAKASFYRAFNAVYSRIGKSCSEEVILQLIRFKCMPCLLYALEACSVNKTQLRSLEFTLNRVLMKVFQTTSMDVIAECRYWSRYASRFRQLKWTVNIVSQSVMAVC